VVVLSNVLVTVVYRYFSKVEVSDCIFVCLGYFVCFL